MTLVDRIGRTGAGLWSARRPRPAPTTTLRRGVRLRGTPYVIGCCLGQGGMGEVYEAEHRQLHRRCVLKVLHRRHAGRGDLADQMRAEARVLASLRHPNLVDVFDLGTTEDGRPFFVMELLRGNDLRRELARLGVIAVPTALDLCVQVLDALGAAHDAGLVHNDVKLENLFLCEDGSLRLLDFGVAVAGHGHARGGVGTPRTMAPEQHGGDRVDARTDVYAAGLVLYDLVAGRGPFDDVRADPEALRTAHLERPPAPPSALAPQRVSGGLDAVVLRAIAKRPADRFGSAREMADAVLALRGERRRRRGAPPPPRSWEDAIVREPAASADVVSDAGSSRAIEAAPPQPGPVHDTAAPVAREAPPAVRGAWQATRAERRARRGWRRRAGSTVASAVVVLVALATIGVLAAGASRQPPPRPAASDECHTSAG